MRPDADDGHPEFKHFSGFSRLFEAKVDNDDMEDIGNMMPTMALLRPFSSLSTWSLGSTVEAVTVSLYPL